MVEWETYKGTSRRQDFPVISILQMGNFNLNPLALALLGKNVEWVELLHDHKARKIGLRSLTEDKPHARRISRRKHTASVNAKGFLNEYKINHQKTKRYSAEKSEDDIVVIDLAKPL